MKDLTEAATFDTPITVPEGDDSMDHLAEDIEAIAQKLANRGAFLKAVTDHAARIDNNNHFTVPQISDVTQCDVAEWQSDKQASDQPSNPTNKWKQRTSWMCVDNCRAHLYTGNGNTSYGLFAIVVNAFWHLTEQKWRQENTAFPSRRMTFDNLGFVRVGQKDAGAPDWTEGSWDDAPMAASDFAASNTVSAVAGILCNASIIAQGTFNYLTTPATTRRVALSDAFGYYYRDPATGNVRFNPTGLSSDFNQIGFPLRLPIGAVLTEIDVRHNLAGSDADTFTLRKRSGSLDSITYTDVAHHDSATGVGQKTTSLTSLSNMVAAGEEYILVWTLNALGDPAAVGGNAVIGIDYTFNDPGPRN